MALINKFAKTLSPPGSLNKFAKTLLQSGSPGYQILEKSADSHHPKTEEACEGLYCPISLLCVTYKTLQRLIHTHVEPIIDSQLSREQAQF